MNARQLGRNEVAAATDVLTEAFASYPIARHVLGSSTDYPARLRAFIGFFVQNTMLRDGWLLGVGEPEALEAVAAASRPTAETPVELMDRYEALWSELGDRARARFEACARASAHLSVDDPHIRLAAIGVRTARQGHGLARPLLEAVHALSADHERSTGVAISTESEANLPLYRHFGYSVVGEATLADDLKTWLLYRADSR